VNRLTEEALRALARAKTVEAIGAALELLPDGDPRARQALLERYRALAADTRRRDSDCMLRSALLRGLRGRALASEVPLLEEALQTYEFRPGEEVAGRLRGAALLVLADLDDALAAFQAVRLLGDPRTSEMSGEPAVTAARLLARQGHSMVLYQALRAATVQPEVAAACFEGLSGAPGSVVAALAEDGWKEYRGPALLALVDLLLSHPDAGRLSAPLATIVEEAEDLDIVRYAATAMVAGRKATFMEALAGRAAIPGKRGELVREALTLLPT
jgi:hypothetical protein